MARLDVFFSVPYFTHFSFESNVTVTVICNNQCNNSILSCLLVLLSFFFFASHLFYSFLYFVGDMRTFEAVDVQALHHLVDCVVFPAKGHRPHTDEMSGSDLDGDKYFVTWYDKLIPARENEDPMDFTSPEKKVLQRPVEVGDMIQFVSDYIKNDQLGIIANAHLVHADHDDEGK